jgi:hypothetical protein
LPLLPLLIFHYAISIFSLFSFWYCHWYFIITLILFSYYIDFIIDTLSLFIIDCHYCAIGWY